MGRIGGQPLSYPPLAVSTSPPCIDYGYTFGYGLFFFKMVVQPRVARDHWIANKRMQKLHNVGGGYLHPHPSVDWSPSIDGWLTTPFWYKFRGIPSKVPVCQVVESHFSKYKSSVEWEWNTLPSPTLRLLGSHPYRLGTPWWSIIFQIFPKTYASDSFKKKKKTFVFGRRVGEMRPHPINFRISDDAHIKQELHWITDFRSKPAKIQSPTHILPSPSASFLCTMNLCFYIFSKFPPPTWKQIDTPCSVHIPDLDNYLKSSAEWVATFLVTEMHGL